MYKFKEGDKVSIAQWWIDKYHPNNSKFVGVFEVAYPEYSGARSLHIKDNDGYVEVFHTDGKYIFSDSESALVLVK